MRERGREGRKVGKKVLGENRKKGRGECWIENVEKNDMLGF